MPKNDLNVDLGISIGHASSMEAHKKANKPKRVFSPAQFRIQRLDGERQMWEHKTRVAGDLSIPIMPTDTIFVFGTRAHTAWYAR